jgi:hypothetical protein
MAGLKQLGVPSLEEIESTLQSGIPRRWGLSTTRSMTFIAEPETGSIWIDYPAETGPAPHVPGTLVLSVRFRQEGANRYFQLGGGSAPLIREIYYFLISVVRRLEESNDTFSEVLQAEISAWALLLRPPTALGRNEQIGLLGEFWVLWRIINFRGFDALHSWIGPLPEPHDFRLPSADVEVKTTLSPLRDHTVSSLHQLTPTPGRDLFVTSIQLQPAGDSPGVTLPAAVDRIRERLMNHPGTSGQLEDLLRRVLYRDADRHLYSESYRLRSVPTISRVDLTFPRLTSDMVADAMAEGPYQRLRRVEYSINLDGLGSTLDATSPVPELDLGSKGDLYA